jgi:O-glycosyl hydrolase
MKNKVLLGMLGLLLAFGLIMAGCSDGNTLKKKKGEEEKKELVNAVQPVIVTQPTGAEVLRGDENPDPLTVEAETPEDGGILSYQWYYSLAQDKSNPQTPPNSTSSSFIPLFPGLSADVEAVYVWVVVTNTNKDATGNKTASVTSSTVTILLTSRISAKAPVITSMFTPYTAYFDLPATWGKYTVQVTEPSDGGTLSYLWHISYTAEGGGGPLENSSAHTKEYTPVFTEGDLEYPTRYVWVVVTNTIADNLDGGTKAVSATSARVAVNLTMTTAAELPKITQDPVSASYYLDQTPVALTVTVTPVSDGGTLSYQWYSNTENSTEDGAEVGTGATSYTPPGGTEGTTYYYVVVSNTNNNVTGTKKVSATSAVATIAIGSRDNALTPAISGQPAVTTNVLVNGDAVTLTVTVPPVSDGGTLSYQWYSNTENSTTGGSPVGTNSPSYQPPLNTAGTTYYYVVVTNTNNDATVNPTATATSNTATVVVWQYLNAQPPAIGTQPQTTNYNIPLAADRPSLSVGASVTDGGSLSYQWYRADAEPAYAIGGASSATYLPVWGETAAAVETHQYYVVVRNTNNNAMNEAGRQQTTQSSTVTVTFTRPLKPNDPVITIQPVDPVMTGITSLPNANVNVSVAVAPTTDEGLLSYRWYRALSPTADGTAIAGTTGAGTTYQPTQLGYYYVIVTSTLSYAVTTTATTTSDRAKVDIPLPTQNVTLTVHNSVNAWPANGAASTATDRYQHIRGYGGMSDVEFRSGNGSPSPDMNNADMHAMFNPDPIVVDASGVRVSGGLGLNFFRICMYDDLDGITNNTVRGPGPSGSGPAGPDAANRDRSDYFSNAAIANSYGAYVLASPWVFPVEYKTSGSTLIGSSGGINTAKFADLAQYFKTYLLRMKNEGAPIFAVIIQNEPDQAIQYEGCVWNANQNNERDFVRILGPVLSDGSVTGYGGGQPTPKVWIGPGENAGTLGTNQNNVVNDATARQYIEFGPRHFYSNMLNRATAFLNVGKEVWQTEHTDTTNASRDSYYPQMANWNWVWHVANEIYCSTALNDESAYIWWYIKRFYGFLGDTGNNSGTGWSQVLPRGYVMSHFSKYAANTTRIRVSASGTFVSNAGTAAGTSTGNSTSTTVSATTLNPTAFASGNNNQGGQNQPTTKVMAFEGMDGNSIIVIAFTPTQNDGTRGQDMGTVRINLPAGFNANSAELMRSNADVRHQMESVQLNIDGTQASVSIPRSNIVSIKFTK